MNPFVNKYISSVWDSPLTDVEQLQVSLQNIGAGLFLFEFLDNETIVL